MTRSLLVPALALALTACTSDPTGPDAMAARPAVAAARRTPVVAVHGTFASAETGVYDPDTQPVQMTLHGSGNASLVGRYTWEARFLLDVATSTAVGTVTLTAADGSTLVATTTGIGVATDGIAQIVETATITGGTGRFDGATGTLRVSRTLDQGSGISSGAISGDVGFGG